MRTLIVHSIIDTTIPHAHSRTLLDQLLEPLLPPSVSLPPGPGGPIDQELLKQHREAQEQRHAAHTVLVQRMEVPNFGTIEKFVGAYGEVVYVETLDGSHADVGLLEGVQDVIADTFALRMPASPRAK